MRVYHATGTLIPKVDLITKTLLWGCSYIQENQDIWAEPINNNLLFAKPSFMRPNHALASNLYYNYMDANMGSMPAITEYGDNNYMFNNLDNSIACQ